MYKYKYGEVPAIGTKFTNWTVIDNKILLVGNTSRKSRAITCKCKCGKESIVRLTSLFSGKSKGCACSAGGQKLLAKKNGIGNLSKTQYYYYIHCANRRDISWYLSMEFIWNLLVKQEHKCALSGLPLILNLKPGPDTTASLDRIDSKLPYQENNVQWVHKDVNKMKSNFSDSQFINICKLVSLKWS